MVSQPNPPLGDGSVPDKVLSELLAAFATEPPANDPIDFDDPSIDLLLGLTSPPNDAAWPVVERGTEPDDTPVSLVAPRSPDMSASVAPTRPPIKIGGDDLPDAVYLNEEGAARLRGGSDRATEASSGTKRTRILIAADDIEGSSGGIPTATGPKIDPRLRARRIAVRRAIGLKRLKWIIIGTSVVLIVSVTLALLGSSLFAVNNVVVSGDHHRIDPTLLAAAVDDLDGHAALLIDTRAIERHLEASPWIKRARVSVDFPHDATIELVEREPLATYVGTDGRFRIVAVDGIVVDVIPGQPIEFMLMTGPGPNVEAGNSVGDAFTRGVELVEALSATVRPRTSSVQVGETGELGLTLAPSSANSRGTIVTLGSPTNLLDKLTKLEAFLQRPDSQRCTVINVSPSAVSPTC